MVTKMCIRWSVGEITQTMSSLGLCLTWDRDPTLLTRAPQEGQGPSIKYFQNLMDQALIRRAIRISIGINSHPKTIRHVTRHLTQSCSSGLTKFLRSVRYENTLYHYHPKYIQGPTHTNYYYYKQLCRWMQITLMLGHNSWYFFIHSKASRPGGLGWNVQINIASNSQAVYTLRKDGQCWKDTTRPVTASSHTDECK